MSSRNEEIRRFEKDPDSFDELVASFLVESSDEEAALMIGDLIESSSVLQRRFEALAKVHSNLYLGLLAKFEDKPRTSLYSKVLLPVAAIFLLSVLGYLYSTRFSDIPETENRLSLSFGQCGTDIGSNFTTIRSDKQSLCDFIFHTERKGKWFKVRLFPNSEANIRRDADSWYLEYLTGSLLLESSYSFSLLGRYPSRFFLQAGETKIEFIGTKVRVFPKLPGRIQLEVLEGELAVSNSSQNPSRKIPVQTGEFIQIPSEHLEARQLPAEERERLRESFQSFSSTLTTDAPVVNPAKILYPNASEIPGNRILLKNGNSFKGDNLLQRGNTYILISKDSVLEFDSKQIRRIEFE